MNGGRPTLLPQLVQGALALMPGAVGSVGASAQPQHRVQGQVGIHCLRERLQGGEAETDDLGSQAQFLLVFSVVCGEGAEDGVAGGGFIASGAPDEQVQEVGDHFLEKGGGDEGEGRHVGTFRELEGEMQDGDIGTLVELEVAYKNIFLII
jgi:hypothetical protein